MHRSLLPGLMVAAGLAGLLTSTPAAAQFAKPEDAIRYRRAGMTMMAAHLGRVAAMANGRVPFDAKAVADNAEIATIMSKLPYVAFIEGSDKGDTNALPKIWSENDKFRAAAAKLQDEMAKLNVAAKSGNIDTIKPAVGAVGQACKACHDAYRKD
jgi:cytochrome c556